MKPQRDWTTDVLDRMERSPLGKAFRGHGFHIEDLGGGVFQWIRTEPHIDIIVSGLEGSPPEKLTDSVLLYVFRVEHSEGVLKLHFSTATTLFRSLDQAEDSASPYP